MDDAPLRRKPLHQRAQLYLYPHNPCPLQGVVRLFGPEIVKLWTAVLLKKRVVVFCPVLLDLLRLMRSIPQLAWHRHVGARTH